MTTDSTGGSGELATESDVLILVDEFGVLALGAPDVAGRAIEQLLVRAGAVTKVGASGLADLSAVAATGAALATAIPGSYYRLRPEQLAKLADVGARYDDNGDLHGVLRNAAGHYAGDLSFEQVSLATEQAIALQTAAVSMALRSAIADVQKAVERVEDRVKAIQQHLTSRLRGDVVGTYRHLQEVSDATSARGHLLEADWDGIAGVRNQLQRDLETLRDYVRSQLREVTNDLSVPKRESKLKALHHNEGSVPDVLRLILVTEQSLHLFEYLRLQWVRQREPEHLKSALEDGRRSLRRQHELDRELVIDLAETVERARTIAPLEIHHVLSIRSLDRQAGILYDHLAEFADAARQTLPDALGDLVRPSVAEARAAAWDRTLDTSRAVKELGTGAAAGGSRLLRQQRERASRRIKDVRPRRGE